MLILHGENTVLSRQRLIGQIGHFQGEVIRLEGERLTLTDLKQALEALSLFGQKRLVVIENFFNRRPGKETEALLKYCQKEKPGNLLVWEAKTIDGRRLVSFKFAKIEKFTIPAIIFKFLESLSNRNKGRLLYFYHECLRQEAPEMIFYMLTRQINNLIIAGDLGERGLEKLASWQKNKLILQAKQFDLKQLLSFYKQLLKIDWEQKTGRSSLSLSSQLDLLLASF